MTTAPYFFSFNIMGFSASHKARNIQTLNWHGLVIEFRRKSQVSACQTKCTCWNKSELSSSGLENSSNYRTSNIAKCVVNLMICIMTALAISTGVSACQRQLP